MNDRQHLLDGLAVLEIELNDDAVERVMSYLRVLQKWNRRINVVGTKDIQTTISRHVIDCLVLLAYVPLSTTRIVDVGSGGGLPGALLAAARPQWNVTALEPIHKKHAFLAAIAREIPLPNFLPVCAKLEDHFAAESTVKYDVAVSRATWSVTEWISRGTELVVPGGCVLAMEGAEQHDIPDAAQRHAYQLADDRTRAIIVVRA